VTQSVNSILALGQSLGLKGFVAKPEKPDAKATSDGKPGASADTLATARKAGLRGFTSSETSPRSEGTMALAVRLGLPGFVKKEAAATRDGPASKPAAVSSAVRVSQTPAAVVPHASASRTAVAAPQMSTQRFVQIDIAAAGLDAFTALEGKMGQSFAPDVRGQTSWLQRDNPDGGQTRAYAAMNSDLTKLEVMGSNLGSPALRMSVGPLPLSQFAMHTSTGRVQSGSQKPASFMNPHVPGALRQALAQ
jgi:hypothetical protein